MIIGLFTEMLTPGGIQRISQHIACILARYARNHNLPYCFLSLNDPIGLHILRIDNEEFTIEGFSAQKLRFIIAILKKIFKIKIAFIAHIDLAPLGLCIKSIKPKFCYIVETYGLDVWEPEFFLWKLSLVSANKVIALSNHTANKLLEVHKIDPKKVIIIPPALDPCFFRKSKNVLVENHPSGKKLLTVARLIASENKGVDIVIKAMPAILKEFPDTCYIVVGDGDDKNRLETLAKNLEVKEHVLFVGNKVGDELLTYYSSCDIFVMPSLLEGFGVVFLEAMTFCKPVIGGNHGGTPEIVRNGKNGFLVEYNNVDILVQKLIQLLSNEKLCKQMGEAGQQLVNEQYSFESFHQRLTALLEGDCK